MGEELWGAYRVVTPHLNSNEAEFVAEIEAHQVDVLQQLLSFKKQQKKHHVFFHHRGENYLGRLPDMFSWTFLSVQTGH